MPKTVLITGASRGIGAAAARLFAARGHCVIVNYNNSADAAHALVKEIKQSGGKAIAVRADVSEETQVETMFRKAEEIFGAVEILVNNAGIADFGLLTDMDTARYQRLMDVNVKGTFLCCRRVLPHMVNAKTGRIVNVSSVWGITGASCETIYSASKAAVIGLTKALAKEVGPSGITVNCVAPGAIETDMNARLTEEERTALCAETPLGRLGKPEEVAAAIYYLTGDDAAFFTGQVLSPDGGLTI